MCILHMILLQGKTKEDTKATPGSNDGIHDSVINNKAGGHDTGGDATPGGSAAGSGGGGCTNINSHNNNINSILGSCTYPFLPYTYPLATGTSAGIVNGLFDSPVINPLALSQPGAPSMNVGIPKVLFENPLVAPLALAQTGKCIDILSSLFRINKQNEQLGYSKSFF